MSKDWLEKISVEITPVTSWERAVNAARLTVHKEPLGHDPSEQWIRQALVSQHSPIRLREYDIVIKNVPYFVMVHFVRHIIGVEKFVATSRDDRVDNLIPREDMPQGSPVTMQLSVNAQSIMNISALRLCQKASAETRQVWLKVKSKMAEIDSLMAEAMMPKCDRLHCCTEERGCGRWKPW